MGVVVKDGKFFGVGGLACTRGFTCTAKRNGTVFIICGSMKLRGGVSWGCSVLSGFAIL